MKWTYGYTKDPDALWLDTILNLLKVTTVHHKRVQSTGKCAFWDCRLTTVDKDLIDFLVSLLNYWWDHCSQKSVLTWVCCWDWNCYKLCLLVRCRIYMAPWIILAMSTEISVVFCWLNWSCSLWKIYWAHPNYTDCFEEFSGQDWDEEQIQLSYEDCPVQCAVWQLI